MGKYLINRSGKNLTVTKTNGGSDVIGTIKPNEVYANTHEWSGNHAGIDYQAVYFRNSSGKFEHGWLSGISGTKAATPLTDCCLYKADLSAYGLGSNESLFSLRRDTYMYQYDADGTIGTKIKLIAGEHIITTQNGTCGRHNPHLMSISGFAIDGDDPQKCDFFIDVCNGSMAFSNFVLEGELR